MADQLRTVAGYDGHWLICFRGCGNVWEPGTNRAFPWHF